MGPRSEDPKLIIRVINFELVQPMCPRYSNVTDGQTDGRTTYDSTRGRVRAEPNLQLGAARTQQKTSALGKPDADLFIARTDANQPAKVTVPSCKLGNTALALHASRGKN